MTAATQSPAIIRFADGSRVCYMGDSAASYGHAYFVVRRNGVAIMAGRATPLYYPTSDAAIAALTAMGEGPAGEMRMREG